MVHPLVFSNRHGERYCVDPKKSVSLAKTAGRSAKTQSRMWVYCNPACSKKYIVLYDYRQTRGGKNAVTFLGNYDGYVVCDGYEWVVDLDIEKYFDTVNHDKLIFYAQTQKHPKN